MLPNRGISEDLDGLFIVIYKTHSDCSRIPEIGDTVSVPESQVVRDLKWILTSPSLISHPAAVERTLINSDTDLKIDAGDLESFLSQRFSHRVGRYFESLVLYWLQRIRQVEVVAHGLQIQDGDRTVGELDFVFRDEAGRLTHWETAVKFYLHFPQENSSGSFFVGPNAADTFEKKTRRILERQLPLSRLDFPDVVVREAFVKGRMFYHPDLEDSDSLPPALSPSHLKGIWLRNSELHRLSELHANAVFRILNKPYWLSPEIRPVDDPHILSLTGLTETLADHFRTSSHSRLLSILTVDREIYRELDRLFVVSDSWPEQ